MNNAKQNEWETLPEASGLFFKGRTLKACLPVALIVGIIFSVINQGDVIIGGSVNSTVWIKVGMNFLIPFLVSSYGFMNDFRRKKSI